jgi:hypothetical protein
LSLLRLPAHCCATGRRLLPATARRVAAPPPAAGSPPLRRPWAARRLRWCRQPGGACTGVVQGSWKHSMAASSPDARTQPHSLVASTNLAVCQRCRPPRRAVVVALLLQSSCNFVACRPLPGCRRPTAAPAARPARCCSRPPPAAALWVEAACCSACRACSCCCGGGDRGRPRQLVMVEPPVEALTRPDCCCAHVI